MWLEKKNFNIMMVNSYLVEFMEFRAKYIFNNLEFN